MIIRNLKLIFRNLWSKRIYTFIILLSLVVGFVCLNILIGFLIYETNTDKFHINRERIFQVFSNDPFEENSRISYIPNYFHHYLIDNYPEIDKVCQFSRLDGISLKVKNDVFQDFSILSTDDSFFSLFDFPLLQGSKTESLNPNSIVLTKKKADILYGSAEVVGKNITINTPDTTKVLTVSAVVDKPNANSHLSFDALVHHTMLPDKWNGGATYALLESVNLKENLEGKVNEDINRPGLIGAGKMDYFFKPLTESYFNTDNKSVYMKTRNPTFLQVGYIICGLVVFIAGFNFVNLFLLFLQDRKKEIGIKKTLGITPKGLFASTILEVSVYIVIAFLLSLIITFFIIPVFNTVFESNLSSGFFLDLKVLASICAVLFISGATLVSFSVAKQWKMKAISLISKDSNKVSFNGLLFTIQFVISITLAICSVTIIQQMSHIENSPLGFNRSMVQLDSPDQKFLDVLPVLKQRVSQLTNVNSITVSGGNPISGNTVVRYELENDKFYSPFLFGGDNDFLKTLKLNLLEGNLPSKTYKGKLVNQELVRQFNISNPIGSKVPGTEDIIIGVVEDFTCGSFKEGIPPVIISYFDNGRSLLIDYEGNNLANLLPKIQTEWEDVFPNYPFEYRVIEDEIIKKHKQDTFLYKIIITFSIISIILSCFGLFAFSWAVIQSRTKEMGIRKILGASAMNVLNLLTLVFTKRISLAFVIAVPIGYYLMNLWLSGFANKIEFNLLAILIPGIIIALIAFSTLSFQTVKATRQNPINEIRND